MEVESSESERMRVSFGMLVVVNRVQYLRALATVIWSGDFTLELLLDTLSGCAATNSRVL